MGHRAEGVSKDLEHSYLKEISIRGRVDNGLPFALGGPVDCPRLTDGQGAFDTGKVLFSPAKAPRQGVAKILPLTDTATLARRLEWQAAEVTLNLDPRREVPLGQGQEGLPVTRRKWQPSESLRHARSNDNRKPLLLRAQCVQFLASGGRERHCLSGQGLCGRGGL